VGQGVSEILTFAIGVAISPVPIIAVILMLFSQRAKVNGPLFAAGWVLALAVVGGVAYAVSDVGDVSTSSSASDSVSWLKIVFGVLFVLLAVRQWRGRPAPGAEPEMPRWMRGIDAFTPGKAFGVGVVLAGVNPKNLLLTLGAATGLAQLGLSTGDAVGSLVVFVLVASVTIIAPVVYYLAGGDRARGNLDTMKGWLAVHDAAVMTVLFLVFGVALIAKGLGPLTN
jgi:threonine/homoserine/homoserine lactone efflux protein